MFDNIEILAVGTQVALNLDGVMKSPLASPRMLALITAAIIRRDGVSYEVAWWWAGTRSTALVTADEIVPHHERLMQTVRPKTVRRKKAP